MNKKISLLILLILLVSCIMPASAFERERERVYIDITNAREANADAIREAQQAVQEARLAAQQAANQAKEDAIRATLIPNYVPTKAVSQTLIPNFNPAEGIISNPTTDPNILALLAQSMQNKNFIKNIAKAEKVDLIEQYGLAKKPKQWLMKSRGKKVGELEAKMDMGVIPRSNLKQQTWQNNVMYQLGFNKAYLETVKLYQPVGGI